MRRSLTILVVATLAVPIIGGSAGAVPPIPLPPIRFAAEIVGMDCLITVTGDTTAKLGRAVEWANDDDVDAHTIGEQAGLWSIQLDAGDSVEGAATAAATFRQACDDGTTYAWEVKLKAPGHPSNPDFKVTWAIGGAKGFWSYHVQYRIGSGGWRTWRPRTVVKSATFDGAGGRTYSFRSRVINDHTDERTDWSPIAKVVT